MEFFAIIIAGAVAGGFVNGLAGFGTGLFALGFFLAVLSPLQAVAIIVIMSIFAGALGLVVIWPTIMPNLRMIIRVTLPGICAVPIGVWALSYVSVDILSGLVAFMLILYGGYFASRKNLPLIKGQYPWLDSTVGGIGGFLGGLAALSGAIPTMWFAMRDMTKQDTRAILQCYNFTLLLLAAIVLAFRGAYQKDTILLSAIAIPVATLSAHIGLSLFKRLSTDQFRRLLIAITLVCGLVMVYRIYA